MALDKVAIAFAHTPVNLPIEHPWLADFEVVLLAVKGVKKVVLSCCDVPLSLQRSGLASDTLLPEWADRTGIPESSSQGHQTGVTPSHAIQAPLQDQPIT